MKIGKYIAARRNELGLSQKELAKMVGYTGESTISRIEHDNRSVPLPQLEKFAKALQCPVESLIGVSGLIDCDFQYITKDGVILFVNDVDAYDDGDMVLYKGGAFRIYHAGDAYSILTTPPVMLTGLTEVDGKVIAEMRRYE